MRNIPFKLLILFFGLLIFTYCDNSKDEDDATAEICSNGIDDDGDGFTDCEDFDCTCEICDNGIDDDGDGFVDGEDSDCSS